MDEVRQLDTGSEASTRPRPHSPQDSARDLELSPPGRRFAPKDGWRSVARFLIAVGASALICSLLGRFAAPSLTGPIDIVGYPTFANFNLWPQFWEYRLLVYGLPFFAIVGYVLLARFGPLRSRSPRPAKRTIELVEPALEKLLISTEIRQLVGAGHRKAHQQCGRRDQATDRRYLRECSLSGHCSPEKIKGLRSPG